MRKNKKQYLVRKIIFVFCMVVAICLIGCANKEEDIESTQNFLLPSFKYLLEEEEKPSSDIQINSAVVPVKIYFDNTGSMEGFTIDKDGKRKPCSLYSKLMRCIRDMGRMQKADYYVLGVNEQDWVLYEESIYDNFYTEGFHVWWKSGQPGPLSKLYMDNRIDDQYVNIVLTDLAEQRLNNTQLAEQIQKLCNEKNCEADLFAFKFNFNGVTQVPDPNAASGMLEQTVHGEKPYYMIITGKSDYMQKYRNELKILLKDAGMKEGQDYFYATNRFTTQNESLTMADIVFEPFADFEQIFMESENNRKAEKTKVEGSSTDELKTYSKNLCRYENTEQLCPGIEFEAFYYQKAEGVSKKQGDWRLNFYIPLNDFKNPQMEYTCVYHIYKLKQDQAEADTDTEAGQQPENVMGNWVEDADARIELSVEVREDFERGNQQYPAVLYLSCKDKTVEKEHEPREQELLLLLDVAKEETYFYERPVWLDEFDTGSTDDYFTRTFNLNGFYDVLFGNKNKISGDGAIHIRSNYAQIPILLTGLKE